MPMALSLSKLTASLAEARVNHQAGRLADAERLYQQVLAVDPKQADALRLLGLLRFQRGETLEAEPLLRQAAAAAPDNAKIQDNLAVVLHALRRDDEALIALQRAVALD